MEELWSLFVENGISMTIEECAEMFSVVHDIKNQYLTAELEKKGKLGKTINVKTMDEKLQLQLNL